MVTVLDKKWDLQVGSANRKIDIFKIIHKLLLCVGVGLIKKTLTWQQIPCIPCSGNLKKLLRINHFHLWHSDTLSVAASVPPKALWGIITCNFEALVVSCDYKYFRHSIFFTDQRCFHQFVTWSTTELHATFTRMFTPKPSTRVRNMVSIQAH